MTQLPRNLRALIESGVLAHLATINPDGSPQVTVIWIGLEDGELVSGHLSHQIKHRNVERDPRVVLSLVGPREQLVLSHPYAVLHATATIEPSERVWDLLDRFAKIYIGPDTRYPPAPASGYIMKYKVERIGGVGPWVDT